MERECNRKRSTFEIWQWHLKSLRCKALESDFSSTSNLELMENVHLTELRHILCFFSNPVESKPFYCT